MNFGPNAIADARSIYSLLRKKERENFLIERLPQFMILPPSYGFTHFFKKSPFQQKRKGLNLHYIIALLPDSFVTEDPQ